MRAVMVNGRRVTYAAEWRALIAADPCVWYARSDFGEVI